MNMLADVALMELNENRLLIADLYKILREEDTKKWYALDKFYKRYMRKEVGLGSKEFVNGLCAVLGRQRVLKTIVRESAKPMKANTHQGAPPVSNFKNVCSTKNVGNSNS